MFAIHAVHGVDRESKVKVCGNVFTIANVKVVGGEQTEYMGQYESLAFCLPPQNE